MLRWLSLAIALLCSAPASAQLTTTGVGGGGFGGGVAATTTWNPSDKSVNISLSGGNLIASQTGGADAVSSLRAVASASTGKIYWEVTATTIVDVGAQTPAGFGNSTQSLSNIFGTSNNSVGWISDGRILLNNATAATIATWSNGNTLCVALDLTNSKVWFRNGAGNWNNDVIGNQNPATNTGGVSISTLAAGPYFAGATLFTHGSDVYTANFGGSAYSQTPPSGFGNW